MLEIRRHADLQGLSIGDDHPQYAQKDGADFTGGTTFECPLVITGDCTNALQVRDAALANTLLVNTISHSVEVRGDSPTLLTAVTASGTQHLVVDSLQGNVAVMPNARLTIGTNGSFPGHGFLFAHQGKFEVLNGGAQAMFLDPTGTGQLLFGDDITPNVQPNVFTTGVAFLGGFAWDERTVSASGGTTVLPADGAVTYVGYTGTGPQTIELPQTSLVLGGAGSKPGAVVIIKDEANLGAGTPVTVTGNGADQIDGVGSLPLAQGASAFLVMRGGNWFSF